MSDRVFSGRDVEAALSAASEALGLPREALRYVVLEEPRPARLGLKASDARVAVLLGGGGGPKPSRIEAAPAPDGDARSRLRALVRALAEATGAEIELDLEDDRETCTLHLSGPGCALFLADEGQAFEAFDHLLERAFAHEFAPQRLRLACQGYRDHRDAVLKQRAQELARLVREDGQARAFEPLNPYERRLVHMAVGELPGVTTFSVGQGRERRVTIAPKPADAPAETGPGESLRPTEAERDEADERRAE